VPTLGPEDWLRLKELFEKARALPTESRPAYVASACHDNPALRLELEELLASHERATTLIRCGDQSAASAAEQIEDDFPPV
jgi:hypothetical protein